MTSETNPESGTTTFTFDADATCGTSEGDLVKRVDANGTVTCYAHDAAHRVTEVSYPTLGAGVAATPNKYFVYDAASVDGATMANVLGRLAEAYTANAATPNTHITDLGFSYPNPGAQEADLYEFTPASGGWYVTTEQRYANGAPSVLTLPSSVAAVTYGVDGEGRPASAAVGGAQIAGSVVYSPYGLTSIGLGPNAVNITDTYTYDTGTGTSGWSFTNQYGSDSGTLTWNPNGSLAKMQIDNALTGSDTQTCTYSHDDLGRIAGADCGAFSQTYSFDPFGNLSTAGSNAFTPDFAAPNGAVDNRIQSANGITPSYNNDGDLIDDPVVPRTNANAFDAEQRPVTLEGNTVIYDALGRAVEADFPGGSNTEYVRGPGGDTLELMNGGSRFDYAPIPLPGGGRAVYSASAGGLEYYEQPDNLGSMRLASEPGGSTLDVTSYSPFGYAYIQTNSTERRFTGKAQDIDESNSGGQYDFPEREYNPIQGRWWTPDPAGLAAVDPNNPQTWNAYAYVAGTPLEATDPLGLSPINCFLATARRLSSGDGCGLRGGGTVKIDGVELGFGLGNDLTGGAFSGGGSASTLPCPAGGCNQIVVVDGHPYTPEPTQNGWQYQNDWNGELLSPGAGGEIGLPDLNGPVEPAFVAELAAAVASTSLAFPPDARVEFRREATTAEWISFAADCALNPVPPLGTPEPRQDSSGGDGTLSGSPGVDGLGAVFGLLGKFDECLQARLRNLWWP